MAEIALNGSNLIAGLDSHTGAERFRVNARQPGEPLEPSFYLATESEVEAACRAASAAFAPFSSVRASERAVFLREMAAQIEELGDALIERATAESALPIARLTGERGRTCGQLRMFANLIDEGSWVDARIDHADANRTPPKPDLRRMLMPLGPVAVFGASNFPLAFSVAGGDTASALAAGCPVVVKAHPAHPGTSELVGRAIVTAAKATGMPDGVFGMLHGLAEVGRALVTQPEIRAVGFTGSKAAGRALFDLGASRPTPIPVYAEMGSVNPVFLLPGALRDRGEAIARGYADSLTLGVGQFCTNPGVVAGLASADFDAFLTAVTSALTSASPALMLTDDIAARFQSAIEERTKQVESLLPDDAIMGVPDVRAGTATPYQTPPRHPDPSEEQPTLASRGAERGTLDHDGQAPATVRPALFATTGEGFLANPELAEEIFGPAGLAVRCSTQDEMNRVAQALHGQLTATIHASDDDAELARQLLPILADGVGRVVFNGFPTGVEVGPAMQHGGPYPATTDPRSTSVGTAAILRFARPVAFQSAPANLLPDELQDENPRHLWRLIDGSLMR